MDKVLPARPETGSGGTRTPGNKRDNTIGLPCHIRSRQRQPYSLFHLRACMGRWLPRHPEIAPGGHASRFHRQHSSGSTYQSRSPPAHFGGPESAWHPSYACSGRSAFAPSCEGSQNRKPRNVSRPPANLLRASEPAPRRGHLQPAFFHKYPSTAIEIHALLHWQFENLRRGSQQRRTSPDLRSALLLDKSTLLSKVLGSTK